MSEVNRTRNVKRYGVDAPLPLRRSLRAGPLSLELEGGDLRYVRVGKVECVRRLYFAVRDRNWGTPAPLFTRIDVLDHGDGFRVDLAAEHVDGDVNFAWTGVIEGKPEGTIAYAIAGEPGQRFLRNRIGFCILHPSDLVGTAARVETPDGPVERQFPNLISPHQPFLDMISISHPVGDLATATISFEGDLFEMEDQRNWTDASYKTYSTPLRLPYPVEVGPGGKFAQRVSIAVTGETPADAEQDGHAGPQIAVDFDSLSPLPPLGFGAGLPGTIIPEDMTRFRSLRPAHLWVSLDLGANDWRDRLAEATDRSVALQSTLDLSVTAGPDQGWHELAAEIGTLLAPVGRIFVFPAVAEPVTFPRTDLATHRETLSAARVAFADAGIDATLGGGSRAYFTELNRGMDFLPVEELDTVAYAINPQVHASDNLSVIETLLSQGETVRSARHLIGDRDLVVGPVTLRPPWNPNATGTRPETPEDELPPEVDARQISLLGAGWTLGSIHRLAEAGVSALTYYELYGWRGLSERRSDLTKRELFPSDPGQLFPLYHVFAAAADFVGGSVAAVTLSDPFAVEALALRQDDRVRILIANFSEDPALIALNVPNLHGASIRVLDETTWDEASVDPEFFRAQSGEPLKIIGESAILELSPFAVACIDGHARHSERNGAKRSAVEESPAAAVVPSTELR